MNITTTARHCEFDQEDRLFAQQRLEKLGRFARDIKEAHLILTAEKYRHGAEITVKLSRHELVSRETADNARAAIEQAAERLEHQLRKFKERRLERNRSTRPREIDGISDTPADAGDEFDTGEE